MSLINKYNIAEKDLYKLGVIESKKKSSGFFEKEKLKAESLKILKPYNVKFLDLGNLLDEIKNGDFDVKFSENSFESENHDPVTMIHETINVLTQKKIKKYSGFSNLNLDDLSNEIESFFSGQKFGYIAEVKPQVFTETDNEGNKIIKCFTAKTLIKTWGNTKETAVNVVLEKKGDNLNIYCGFTGNKGVLSTQGVFGMVVTGGVSLIGNAASAIKDGKMVDSTLLYIDELLNNLFQKDSNINQNSVKDNSNDIPLQLEKLAALKDKGIISEDEFNSKKKELLDRM
jgi:hypothetical protein